MRLIAQPGLGVDAGNVDVEIEPAAWLGLLSARRDHRRRAGSAMLDERTDAPESVEQTEDVLRVRGGRGRRRATPPPDRAPDALADPPTRSPVVSLWA